MLFFGHVGITMGTYWLVTRTRSGEVKPPSGEGNGAELKTGFLPETPASPSYIGLGHYGLAGLGSMLPDIIDKPVGLVFFRETFSNGRIFAHTLLFLIVFTLIGLYLYWKRRKGWLLPVSFGWAMHLLLDAMWLTPETLLWPLFGWTFPRMALDNYLLYLWTRLLSDPSVFVPEIIGVFALGGLMVLWQRSFHSGKADK